MGFRGGGRQQRPPKPTRQQLSADRRASDLAHGHERRRITDLVDTFDPPQLAAGEIDAGMRPDQAPGLRSGSCRSATFPDLEAQWAMVQGQWLWGVALAGRLLESGWAGNRGLARRRAIDALGRQVVTLMDVGHA